MVPSMINSVDLDDTVTSKLDSSKLLAENEKVQDDLAFKLRNLIANFCDEHFVKYLKENKLDKSSNVAQNSEKEMVATNQESKNDEEEATKLNETVNNESNDSSNNVEMIDVISPANSSSEVKETVEVTKNSDLNLTSTSSLTPPRSSYSSTSSSSSSSSSSPSSDINTNSHSNDEANKSLEHDPESSSHSSEETSEKPVEEEIVTLNETNSIAVANTDTIKTSTSLNDIIDKLEIIDHASKTIKEISTSAELNHHRLQHMELQKEELQTQSSALEKLWSQILIGADKLEIFGSIHVRSNNVRLFSCLIDEQLHIDNQSFSSASSCVSQDSCSSKILIKKSNCKLNSLRSKNLYKYERQMAMSNYYRKKINHDSYRRYKKAQQHAQNFYDLNHSDYNHYYHQKHHQKQQKLAKKVDDLIKAVSPENTKKVEEPYPMKKFKAYHSYCSEKRKSTLDVDTSSAANKADNQSQGNLISEKGENNEVTSLSNLATVAAAAMRLSPAEIIANNSNTSEIPAPVKKSRKSSITNSVKQRSFSKDLDADVELEIDEDDYANNSLLIDQPNGKINEFYNLYEGEEDFEDTSSVLSGTSSFVSSQNKDHHHRRNQSAHSRCSSFGENGGLSSRSISLNGDISHSPSKVPNKVATVIHRSISPASSLTSSNFDYDDEQVYQSYCSTSSFKSDYEDEYGAQGEHFSNKKYHDHSRKTNKHKKTMNEDNDKANENVAVNRDVIMKEKLENGSSQRHYHRRKQHLIDAEHKEDGIQNEFKTENDNKNQLQMQQAQLKLQQLPKLLGLQQQQHQELQQQQEEARKNDDYLAKKYKYNRRFAPYSNSTAQVASFNSIENNGNLTENANNNLYLLAQSRHHHRMNQSDLNIQNDPTKNVQYQNGHVNTNTSNKLMSVNSLVDRLSPISDPDTERKAAEQSKIHHQASGHNEAHMLNRINNLSPSSSSSSSSSNKNHQNGNSSINQLFHNNSLQQQAAFAAASQSTTGSSPHNHLNGHSNHAQSVAALLANMQHDQQHNSQDVAKVLAATLNTHHHMNQHNHHTQQIINRFSSNPSQSELMAAVLAQQQQQQHRSLLESSNQFNLNPNGQLYSRYSSHINAAVAAAAAAAASNSAATTTNGHNSRRAHSVESDAHTPSPPASTPANGNGQNGSGSSSLSSSSSSSSSTSSENYAHNSKYIKREDMCKKECPSSVNSHSNDPNANGNEKVRLVPGYDVFISANDLNACNDDRGSATRLLRNLMDVFFDKSTLAKSSINGTGRITNTLDKHVISALFAYVKNRYQDVPHSQLTRAATDKCVQTRRNFRKKIKAAQSYFGMFPSIMIQRPPVKSE